MVRIIRSWLKKRYVSKLVRSGLKLGEGVYLNDGFFLDPAHCFLIEIGDGVVFGPRVSVFAHDASSRKVLGKTRVGRVVIEAEVFVGAGSVILPGVTIGARSIIGANSTVTRSIPPCEIWGGTPARHLMHLREYRESLRKYDQPPLLPFIGNATTPPDRATLQSLLRTDRYKLLREHD